MDGKSLLSLCCHSDSAGVPSHPETESNRDTCCSVYFGFATGREELNALFRQPTQPIPVILSVGYIPAKPGCGRSQKIPALSVPPNNVSGNSHYEMGPQPPSVAK